VKGGDRVDRSKRGASGDDLRAYGRYYSDRDFNRKIRGLPRRAGQAVLEKSLTLYVILTDAQTPLWARALVVSALGYWICPFDAVPDAIPVLGYADDVAVMALVLSQLDRFVTPGMRERVRGLLPEGMKSRTTTKERRTRRHEQDEDERGATGGDAAGGES